MRQILSSRFGVLLVVLLVAMSGMAAFAGGAAADTTTLAGDGSDEVAGFEANSSNDIETSVESDGTDFDTDGSETVHMNVSYDGTEYASTSEDVSDGTSTSQTVNMSLDALDELPGDAGESTTVNVSTWGENSSGGVTTPETSFEADITFDNSYAATSVDDDAADIEEVESSFFSLDTFTLGALGDSDPADLHTYDQTVGVNGSDTTVTLTDSTSDGSDAFDDALGDEKESGDLIYGASASVDGTPVLAFYEEADSDIVNESGTHAVYDGDSEWTFHLGEEHADADEVDIGVTSQSYTEADYNAEDLGSIFMQQADMGLYGALSNFGFGSLSAFNVMDLVPFVGGFAMPTLAFGFAVAHRKRRLGSGA